jgi:hypothetical protein
MKPRERRRSVKSALQAPQRPAFVDALKAMRLARNRPAMRGISSRIAEVLIKPKAIGFAEARHVYGTRPDARHMWRKSHDPPSAAKQDADGQSLDRTS